MHLAKRVFEAGAGPNLISGDVLNLSWLDGIRHRDMMDIRCESDTRLNVSGTTTLNQV